MDLPSDWLQSAFVEGEWATTLEEIQGHDNFSAPDMEHGDLKLLLHRSDTRPKHSSLKTSHVNQRQTGNLQSNGTWRRQERQQDPLPLLFSASSVRPRFQMESLWNPVVVDYLVVKMFTCACLMSARKGILK